MTTLARHLAARVALAGLLGALTTACHRKAEESVDPSAYETPAAEAVLHHLLEDTTDVRKEAKVGVIVLGDRMTDSTPAFREKFPEAGLQWFSSQSLATVWVGPVARIVEKSTQLQPFQVQIFKVSSFEPSPHTERVEEVIAAWAFEDRMVRRRYHATPAPDGQWDVQPLDIIEQKPPAQ